ncbi:MAG: NAD(P)H-hydrate dehydratase [Marinicellaceae bacterium]
MKSTYLKSQIKQVDKLAAKYLKISSYDLMKKASQAIFNYVHQFSHLLVVAGAGNNAGDGYVIAKLAKQQGKRVLVWSLFAIDKLPKDAKQAADDYMDAGGKVVSQIEHHDFDCIIDAIFGTGLCREISGNYAKAINWINQQKCQKVSVDIPSGLDADTGNILGCAVIANMTITVICYKPGLLTNNGKGTCGTLFLEELNIPSGTFKSIQSVAYVLQRSDLKSNYFFRQNNSHKGTFGTVIIAGGHDGMLGALLLAGKSALRSGCGLVEVVSNNDQAVMLSIHCPELMTSNSIKASRTMTKANVIAVGPGLGLNTESKSVVMHCIKQNKLMVLDADALTLIANNYQFDHNVILTPHPKEAATLLGTDVKTIQNNRILAAKQISKKYKAVTILKGSGTVVADSTGKTFICPYGYSGMSTAGMGDVLTGVVASIVAQGAPLLQAAYVAVLWHALAAESCHKGIGLIASDVIEQLPSELL